MSTLEKNTQEYVLIKKDGKACSFYQYVLDNEGKLPNAVQTPNGKFVLISEIQFIKYQSAGQKFTFLEAVKDGEFLALHLCFAADTL